MPFISNENLEEKRQSAFFRGWNKGYDLGFKTSDELQLHAQTSHLDALDLVIDALDVRKQYPDAQRFYDDLIAAKKFRADREASRRIDAVSIRMSSKDMLRTAERSQLWERGQQ